MVNRCGARCNLDMGHAGPHAQEVAVNASQLDALRLASENGYVKVGPGYGRNSRTAAEIDSATYRALVRRGYLTPLSNGHVLNGELANAKSGRRGYLTDAGRAALGKARA